MCSEANRIAATDGIGSGGSTTICSGIVPVVAALPRPGMIPDADNRLAAWRYRPDMSVPPG